MVSYTAWSMTSLRMVLNAFAKSSLMKICSWVMSVTKLLAAWTAASPPPGVAMPTWRGAKKGANLLTVYLLAHFADSLGYRGFVWLPVRCLLLIWSSPLQGAWLQSFQSLLCYP